MMTREFPLIVWQPCGAAPGVTAIKRHVVTSIRQLLCGLRGHELVDHFEPGRMALRCLNCGVETPGWTIDVKPAVRHDAATCSPRPAHGVHGQAGG